MATISLCNMAFIDNTYRNVLDFDDIEDRKRYFNSKVITTVDVNIQNDTMRDTITIPRNHSVNTNINYIFFNDNLGKTNFYFVNEIQFKTEKTCIFHVELDVWTTYYFDHQLLQSFVERCHVNRWGDNMTPMAHLEDEGLEMGDMKLDGGYEKIGTIEDGIVICASAPIGKLEDTGTSNSGGSDLSDESTEEEVGSGTNSNTGGSSGGNTGSVYSGSVSSKLLRFIKGQEGFAPWGQYFNGESFRTGGYGITEKYAKSYYNKMKPFPCTEKKATQVLQSFVDNETGKYVKYFAKQDGVPLSKMKQHQYDAICSLGHSGIGTLRKSPMWKMMKTNINDPKIKTAWLNYAIRIAATGQTSTALKNRRKWEVDMYFNNKYYYGGIGKYDANGKYAGEMKENNGNGYMP